MKTSDEILTWLKLKNKTHVYCEKCWAVFPIGSDSESHIIDTDLCPKCSGK